MKSIMNIGFAFQSMVIGPHSLATVMSGALLKTTRNEFCWALGRCSREAFYVLMLRNIYIAISLLHSPFPLIFWFLENYLLLLIALPVSVCLLLHLLICQSINPSDYVWIIIVWLSLKTHTHIQTHTYHL